MKNLKNKLSKELSKQKIYGDPKRDPEVLKSIYAEINQKKDEIKKAEKDKKVKANLESQKENEIKVKRKSALDKKAKIKQSKK